MIKKDEEEGGVLEFGTEVVSESDGSLAALLGASPGASTAVSIMLNILDRCFGEKMRLPAWQEKIRKMIPGYGKSLHEDPKLCREMRAYTARVLGLESEKGNN